MAIKNNASKFAIYILKRRMSNVMLYILLLIIASFIVDGCHKKSKTTFSSDPDNFPIEQLRNNDQYSDSIAFSGRWSVRLSNKNKYGLNLKLNNIQLGQIYEASLFHYHDQPTLKLAIYNENNNFYRERAWSHKQVGEWHEIKTRFRIPDDFKGDSIKLFAFYPSGNTPVYVDSLVARKLAPEKASSTDLPRHVALPLAYQLLNNHLLYKAEPLSIQNLPEYTTSKASQQIINKVVSTPQQAAKTFEHYDSLYSETLPTDLRKMREQLSKPHVSFQWDSNMAKLPVAGFSNSIIYQPEDTITLNVENSENGFTMSINKLHSEYKLQTILRKSFQHSGDTAINIHCQTIGSGFFQVILKGDSSVYKHPVIITKNQDPEVAILAPITTWHAYNSYGGKSLYRNAKDSGEVNRISTQRPLNSVTYESAHEASNDVYILKNIYDWFKKRYSTAIYPDFWLEANPDYFDDVETVVLALHCEYFSPSMYKTLKELTDEANLLSLGGNQVYWKVRWHDTFKTIECRKDGEFFENTMIPGGQWRNSQTNEAKLLGVAFTNSGYNTHAPYRVTDPLHEFYNGINVSKEDTFGRKGINGRPISGVELDKMNHATPNNAELLAKGCNPGNSGGEIVYIGKGDYGTLSCGSIACGSGLGVDSLFTQIIENFMDKHHNTSDP